MKNFLSFFLLLLGITSLHASHIVAGDIYYDCANSQIVYTEYSDCSGLLPPTSLDVTIEGLGACAGQNTITTLNQVSSFEVTPVCPGTTTQCNGGAAYGVRETKYVGSVVLTFLPGCNARVVYSNCCRNASVMNLSNASMSNFFVLTDSLSVNGCNSTPKFLNDPVIALCAGQSMTFSQAATEADGDVLVYSLANNLSAVGTSIAYNLGYSTASPMGSNWNVSINANTGKMSFTSTGTNTVGNYALAINVDEYRNGVHIGRTVRDMQVMVANCASSSYNCCHADYDYTLTANTANFTGITSGSAVTGESWNFGDGTGAVGANATHNYTSTGNYLVTYTVAYASGCTTSVSYVVSVTTVPAPPIASFTYVYSSPFFIEFDGTATSGTAPYTYSWTFSSGQSSNMEDPNMLFSVAGTYTACFYVTDANGLTDSACQSYTVTIPPCDPLFNFTVNNMSADFTLTNFNSATVYTINYGDGSATVSAGPVSASPIFSHTYAANGVYTVCMNANSGACSQDTCFNVAINVGVDIDGYIYSAAAGGTPDSFIVYLIEYTNTGGGTLTKVDSQYVNGNPAYYNFPNVNSATMIFHTKAAMTSNSPNYAIYIPTYYDNALIWANSTPICIPCMPPLPATFDIYMQTGTNPGGPGFIGGLISLGANKTGDPAQKIEVMLWDMNDNPITYTYTDMSGNFGISNLAYGTYKVYPEVIGLVTEPYIVTIDGTNPTFNGVDMTMGDSLIAPTVVGVEMPSLPSAVLYPNPTSDKLTFQAELSHAGMIHIEMYNAMGQKVYAFEEVANMGKYTHKMTVENMAAGVYTLKVSAENNGTQTLKVIVNH